MNIAFRFCINHELIIFIIMLVILITSFKIGYYNNICVWVNLLSIFNARWTMFTHIYVLHGVITIAIILWSSIILLKWSVENTRSQDTILLSSYESEYIFLMFLNGSLILLSYITF